MNEATLAQNCSCQYVDLCVEMYSARWRIARKPNKCIECNDTIQPGERYQFVWGRYDGYWYTAVTCQTCVAIWADFFPNCMVLHGNLADEFQECYGFDYRYEAGAEETDDG